MPPIAPPMIAALECVDVDCCSGVGIGVFDCVAIAIAGLVDEKEVAGRDRAEEMV